MVGRGARLLLILALTGCAVEGPAPVTVLPPAPPRVPAPIISGFGDWDGAGGVPRPWQHYGIDIRTPIGTAVLAAADGEVLRVGRHALAGKNVVILHAPDFATVYLHLSEIAVRAGQTVWRGDVIGRAGMTGNATTPHLHFGVCRRPEAQCGARLDTGWEDPVRYWVEGDPCFDAERTYADRALRLTYPIACSAPAA